METQLADQILETWQINHRSNLKLLDSLNEKALELTISKRGGGKIGHQLAHMYNVRFWKLEKLDQTLTDGLQSIKSEDPKTIKLLREKHIVSADKVETAFKAALESEGQFKKGWKRGVVPLLGYFIHHEAHHRGNILLTLKLSGFKTPQTLKYGIWEWSKL